MRALLLTAILALSCASEAGRDTVEIYYSLTTKEVTGGGIAWVRFVSFEQGAYYRINNGAQFFILGNESIRAPSDMYWHRVDIYGIAIAEVGRHKDAFPGGSTGHLPYAEKSFTATTTDPHHGIAIFGGNDASSPKPAGGVGKIARVRIFPGYTTGGFGLVKATIKVGWDDGSGFSEEDDIIPIPRSLARENTSLGVLADVSMMQVCSAAQAFVQPEMLIYSRIVAVQPDSSTETSEEFVIDFSQPGVEPPAVLSSTDATQSHKYPFVVRVDYDDSPTILGGFVSVDYYEKRLY